MKILLTIIFLAVSVALAVIVLMQEGKSAGLGSIGGIGDTYWGKNKSRSMEGQLVRITKILAAAFLLIALLLNMIPDKTTSSSATTEVSTEAEVTTEVSSTEAEAVAEAATEAQEAVSEAAEAVSEAAAEVMTEAEETLTEA